MWCWSAFQAFFFRKKLCQRGTEAVAVVIKLDANTTFLLKFSVKLVHNSNWIFQICSNASPLNALRQEHTIYPVLPGRKGGTIVYMYSGYSAQLACGQN